MSDAHMVSKIAWMIHGECMEWIENEEDYKKAARKLIEIVRKHDKRLTKRAADLAYCACKHVYIGAIPKTCPKCKKPISPNR